MQPIQSTGQSETKKRLDLHLESKPVSITGNGGKETFMAKSEEFCTFKECLYKKKADQFNPVLVLAPLLTLRNRAGCEAP